MRPACSLRSILLLAFVAPTLLAAPPEVDFAREVYPIFRRACFDCHGPKKEEGGLRLDQRSEALRGGDSGPAWSAGNSGESELVRRISLPHDDGEVMPARGALLTKSQIDRIRRWIDAGANWPEKFQEPPHWAYIAPVRPTLPAVRELAWVRSTVDPFILVRREEEGLKPSPEADRAALIRRVSLDLVGLPPSPAEIDAFVSDRSPDAYDRLVDRLLASPEFGVRWARPWLDYARYADSHGFQRDDLRDNWPYRDWVVDALNADMPFDRFTIEQLAGDLLPEATESQKIATGFNRNAPTNVEAGSDPQETRANQVHDRINTLGMVWLGTTLECCQCHDHKYDPFSMRDYYGLFAAFNNTALEADRANPNTPGSIRFLGPKMAIGDPVIAAKQKEIEAQIADARARQAERGKDLAVRDAAWEEQLLALLAEAPREHVLRVTDFDSLGGATHEVLSDGSVLVSGEAPDKDTYTVTVETELSDIRAIKLETLTDPSLPGKGPGRGDAKRPNFVLNTFALKMTPAGGQATAVTFTKATADFSQKNLPVDGAIDDDPKTAWAINPKFHEPHHAVFEIAAPLTVKDGDALTFELVQNFGGSRTIGRLRLSAITGKVGGSSLPADVAGALETPPDDRSRQQSQAIIRHRQSQDEGYQALTKEVTRLEAELKKIELPSTLVMQELDTPRMSTIFQRGDFRTPGETIAPRTPGVLHKLESEGEPLNRLGLARWLVDQRNPLVARVTVNRWWGELFGRGLVATPEDFGIQGEPPTHPELLDHLAVEFMESGWSMKHVLRTIVLSATYRQSSRVTPELLARDDQNRLYARGPRFRLDAEAIRDNALAIAGLISSGKGGAPIRPYQPEGLWIKVGGERYEYVVSPGDEKYRRGLYVVLKRGAPYPSFINFDGNARMACRVKRPRSNTPLQALTLLNDPVYVEAAQALAERVLREKPSDDERLAYLFRLATAREPSAEEAGVLQTLLDAQRADANEDHAAAKKLLGERGVPDGTLVEDLAAWYAVATAVLNLDETITKE